MHTGSAKRLHRNTETTNCRTERFRNPDKGIWVRFCHCCNYRPPIVITSPIFVLNSALAIAQEGCRGLSCPPLLVGTSPMISPYTSLRFPLWQFLNQPLFDANRRVIFNPHRFWYVYQVQILERCLAKDFTSPDGRRD